jgi:hypothetical protein
MNTKIWVRIRLTNWRTWRIAYGHANDSNQRAAHLYQETLSHRRHQNHASFEAIGCRGRQAGAVNSPAVNRE